LLGTFVEILARASTESIAARAIEAAFDAVTLVHRLMSFHDSESDLSWINRHGFADGVRVHPWTWEVLKAAERYAYESDGIFDITVATEEGTACWHDVILADEFVVRLARPARLDLGGIAKGFAVDCAVEALRRTGVVSGMVNAGGDLRVFGSPQEVHLRNPICPTQFSGKLRLRDRALATSATYFAPNALINGQSGQVMGHSISVSVAAEDCMTADALTKVVFTLKENSAPLLARFGADAVFVRSDGTPSWMFESPCLIHGRVR
jgi:thiamine biosynthesis lipoprotein